MISNLNTISKHKKQYEKQHRSETWKISQVGNEIYNLKTKVWASFTLNEGNINTQYKITKEDKELLAELQQVIARHKQDESHGLHKENEETRRRLHLLVEAEKMAKKIERKKREIREIKAALDNSEIWEFI